MGSFGLGHERFNLIIPHISFPQAHIHGIFYAKFVDAWGTTKNGGFIMSTLNIKSENGKIFCPLADSWHIETPEEKVRQEYIKILVEDYGCCYSYR